MKFSIIFICISSVLSHDVYSQNKPIEYYSNILPIIQTHCMPCHQKGNAAPLSLETYEEVKKNSKLISYVTNEKIMPPWKADTCFSRFLNENIVSQNEKHSITEWLKGGCIEGEKKKKTEKKLSILAYPKPDLIFKMHKPHRTNKNNKDEFVTYIEKNHLQDDILIRCARIVPGNKKRVHHLRIDLDTINQFNHLINQAGYINTEYMDTIEPNLATYFFADYVPGVQPFEYPENMGMKVFDNSNFLFNIHYSPSPIEDYDQSELHLYFADVNKNKPIREVYSYNAGIPYENIITIPADSLFEAILITPPTDKELSVISIQPHMHLIGEWMKVICITPLNDTIPLIYIPEWDFNWQLRYYYPKLIHIPKGSIFIAKGKYNNTTQNPKNPFSPPKEIRLGGMKTGDEMLDFYLHVTEYQSGDEKINLTKEDYFLLNH